MKMNKMKCIFLLVLIVSMLTACMNEPNTIVKDSTAKEKGIDLYGTYDQNHLQVITLEKEHLGIVCEIPQIEGLKDTDIQRKVNQDICERVESTYEEFSQLNYVNYNTMANFSNVISIGVYIGTEDTYEQIYLNYNLVNGKRLTFDELFLADADVLDITRNAFCEMLIKDQMMDDFDNAVVSFDENELYKIVKRYNESEEKEFAFTPSEIYFYYKDYVASVKMLDIADDVSLYSKYLTEESLYDRDDIGREDIFTCVNIPESAFEIFEYGYLADNLWYDVSVREEYLSDVIDKRQLKEYADFKEDIYGEVFDEIENYQEIAEQNPDCFYILLAKPTISMEIESEWTGEMWKERFTEQAVVNKNIQVFEMSREMYDTVYRDKLIDAYRYKYFAIQGGVYLEATEGVRLEEIAETMYYNYITGEQLINE